jgi:hypothetical protein
MKYVKSLGTHVESMFIPLYEYYVGHCELTGVCIFKYTGFWKLDLFL